MTTEEKNIATKTALLASAQELFVEKGYAAVGTREIAERAGVNLGAIKYHFGSKAALFMESVRGLMARRHKQISLITSPVENATQIEAAVELCVFIRELLRNYCVQDGPDVCRIMYREINGAPIQDAELHDALVTTVVNEFIKPIDTRLSALLEVICPDATEETRGMIIHSIISQCSFYFTHRPFIEMLRGVSLEDSNLMDEASEHIAQFTLRGIGIEEETITTILAQFRESSV